MTTRNTSPCGISSRGSSTRGAPNTLPKALILGLAATFALSAQLIPFEKDDQWGYRTPRGKVAIEPRFAMAERFSREGIAAVADSKGWAYIDTKGNVLIRPFNFDNGPDPFHQGLARFVEGGKFGFFDRRARVAIPAKFDFAWPFSEGRAAVCEGCRLVPHGEHSLVEGGRWGFIDRTGALVIPYQYEEAESFRKNKARVRFAGSWKSIDRQGKIH